MINTTTATTPAIDTEDLSKAYPGAEVRAVDGLTFAVARGAVYCLLGRNGAGKTTTIRMLTTLLTPTSGRAEVLGVPVSETRWLRPLIGVALQEVALDLWMSPIEQIRMSLAMAGWSKPDSRRREAELVEQFGIGGYRDKKVGQLSGGMRRRVDVALAVSHNPQLLFLDEPSSGLDVEGKEEVWHTIGVLRSEGRTVLLTTHDMDEAVTLSDQIGIMKDGKLVASGATREFTEGQGFSIEVTANSTIPDEAVGALAADNQPFGRADARTLAATKAFVDATTLATLTAALERNGLGEARVEIRCSSLRDIFLETTA
jgi:ABC-2 type transport system ATP-binding protein